MGVSTVFMWNEGSFNTVGPVRVPVRYSSRKELRVSTYRSEEARGTSGNEILE